MSKNYKKHLEENISTFCVYKHTNKINGKVYIGQTRYGNNPIARWGKTGNCYKNSFYFYNAIKKYGWDNFEHEILYNNLTVEEANYYEQLEIEKYNSNNPEFGYNLNTGGNNFLLNEEVKQRISVSKSTPEYREHISNLVKGLVVIHKENIEKRVHPEDVQQYLDNGWELGKSENSKLALKQSLKNKSKEEKETQNNKIANSLLDYYKENPVPKERNVRRGESIKKFWDSEESVTVRESKSKKISKALTGIKQNRDPTKGNKNKGRIKINNGIETKAIFPKELDKYLNNSWKLGYKDRILPATTGKISITNGKQNKFILPEELKNYELQGWYKGKTYFKDKRQ